jgi:hypothetical protein
LVARSSDAVVVAAVDILEGSFLDVGQDVDMDVVALGFAVFDFVEMDNHRSQTTLEYFVYMGTALNRIPLAIAAHCATEAVVEVGQKDGLDRPLGKMLEKRMGRNLYDCSLGMDVWPQTAEVPVWTGVIGVGGFCT